jgi:hypothetical protein
MKTESIILTGLVCAVSVLVGGCLSAGSGQAGRFPAYLAGTWRAEEGPWQIVLTPDGRVDSAVVSWEEVMRPNQTTKFKMQDGNISHLTAGDFFVKYRPADRVLLVSIELKEIQIYLPGGVVEGDSVEIFEGPISSDGTTWSPDKTTIFDYGPDWPQDEGDKSPQPFFAFKKVKEQPKAVADSNTAAH